MFAAIARGPSMLREPLTGEDCLATARCLQQMGATIERSDEGFRITPAREWRTPDKTLDCGNSGTTLRLLSGLIGSRPINATLDGDASLRRRPMGRVAAPLRQMGVQWSGDHAPIQLKGGEVSAIRYDSPIASAQVKSAILLAALRAEGTTTVTEPEPSRDHTERMLAGLGAPIRKTLRQTDLKGPYTFDGFSFTVPADISSAAFFAVAAAVIPGSDLSFLDVGLNPSRTGLIEILEDSGAWFALEPEMGELNEPTGTLHVRHGGALQAFEISGARVPKLIDEIPVLAVLATQCQGLTVIRDASELKVKESDRIATVVEGLRAMGARIEATPDGMLIEGPTPLTGTQIDAALDHRIAMAFAVAGLVAEGETEILGADAVQTSFPEFWETLVRLQKG